MSLKGIEGKLPPGFRFYPRDDELVCYYLCNKVEKLPSLCTMVEVDLHNCEPWELPDAAELSPKEWYFFTIRDRKYATGFRMNRATSAGYWKATGKDRPVIEDATQSPVGMRKTLVFYRGRAPNGCKTDWVMHEFRLDNSEFPPKEDWVLCKVFHKNRGEHVKVSMDMGKGNGHMGCPCIPGYSYSSPNLEQDLLNLDGCHQVSCFSNLSCPLEETPNTQLNLAELHYNFMEFAQLEDPMLCNEIVP
ncbi:NAC domain-containing protein 21/22 [Amborella trichopoda]|uniref:NAC domain-containing protein n=1 Tax=Amborella trichopoda TaxID=13333 RepID=U5D968_AMBTC|nr:NAC domain-containing protein 21/22 [Amborella trichopoda]ERN18775.1 hypothetical protein AMTR_s00067p00064350 [Amborella trichopoda]|eukprot:XP_006857308.1 NAC domain-containing protein 21/22 [Amborella trichopoda]